MRIAPDPPSSPAHAGVVADVLVGPVTNILTRIELMLLEADQRTLPPETIEDLRTVLRNVRRLVHVVDAFRYAARQAPAGWGPLHLNEAVERAARTDGPPWTTVLDPADPIVLANANAIEQLLKTMLTEAGHRAAPDHMKIGTTCRADCPGWVEVTITGLPAAVPIPPGLGSVLEDHRAITEVRPGGDGSEFVLSMPLLALPLAAESP